MPAYGVSVFCEDIRQEVDGKFSFVGVFPADMYIPQFPFIIAKLSIACFLVFPKDTDVSRLTLMGFFPGDNDDAPRLKTIFSATLNKESTSEGDADLDPDVDQVIKIVQTVVLSPVHIGQPGILKVRIKIGEQPDLIKAGTIRILPIPAPSSVGGVP